MCMYVNMWWLYKYLFFASEIGEFLTNAFHLFGGGPNPWSLKIFDSGQIPKSSIPMITLLSKVVLLTF